MKIKYKPKTKEELKTLCDDLSVNLGEIDTSKITNMSGLFYYQTKRTNFSGIENWDVSNVRDMEAMFEGASAFNQDLSGWRLDSIKEKALIFKNSPLEKLVKTILWDWSKYHEQSN